MKTMLRLVTSVLFCCFFLPAALAQDVFINEIHYDNSGADTGEGIEIAGPAGTDLSGWSIVLYNGSNGAEYNNIALSGTIADLQGGLGTVSFTIAGIQNGNSDLSPFGAINMLNAKYLAFGPGKNDFIKNEFANGNAWFINTINFNKT